MLGAQVRLVRPQLALFASYAEFIEEMRALGDTIWTSRVPAEGESADSFVARLLRKETAPDPPAVPETVHWAVVADRVVGLICLRHTLTEKLAQYGGHVGYEVRPSSRRQGVATAMLRLLRRTARARSIGRILVTCAPSNTASRKAIEANGGVLESIVFVDEIKRDTCRYFIDVDLVQAPLPEDGMGRVRVAGLGVSLDGFAAGTEQSMDNPLGKRGPELFQWFFPTRTFRAMNGAPDGTTGTDDDFAKRGMAGFGAFILGRNMYAASRGAWTDDGWKGWWGEDPPYHAPTFILTHHPHASIEMQGGTTFHFVSEGIEVALERARAAAGAKDVKIGGGVETVRQYLRAGLVDEMHLAVAPVVLGQGEALFKGIDLRALGFRTTEHVPTERATHVVLAR